MADDLLAHADAAMYEAKAQGKGRIAIFEASMRVRAWSRLEAESDAGLARPRQRDRSRRDDELRPTG